MSDYILDEQVGYLLRLASQRHTALFQSLMVDGITPTQFSALMRIAEQGECSQNKLGRMAGMDVATIKGVVDRLRQKGLVNVCPDASDKRRSLISLSSKGVELAPILKEKGLQITEKTLSPLSEIDRKALLAALQKMS